jgi:hypothetical protein
MVPVPNAEAKQIGRWLADLGSDRFEVRQKATEALERVELLAEPAIQEALKANPPLEARQRLERLLDRLDPAKCGERQRLLWCVELLEQIGIPAAREVLTSLAGGADGARLTREAKEALKRLDGKP